MKLADRIRLARRKSGLSQLALARHCGVARSAVANWESTKSANPATVNLIAIANATQLSFEWLATGRGRMQMTRDSDPETEALPTLEDPHERRLLNAYRAVSPKMRVALLEVLEEMAFLRTGRRPAGPRSRTPLEE